MGIVKLGAVIAGMLDLKGAQEWVVTTKLGSSDVRPGTTPVVTRNLRLYGGEMAMSCFVLSAAVYGVFTENRWTFSIFLFLQGMVFFAFGLNLVDCGGILGGRLDSGDTKLPAKKAATMTPKRTFSVP